MKARRCSSIGRALTLQVLRRTGPDVSVGVALERCHALGSRGVSLFAHGAARVLAPGVAGAGQSACVTCVTWACS